MGMQPDSKAGKDRYIKQLEMTAEARDYANEALREELVKKCADNKRLDRSACDLLVENSSLTASRNCTEVKNSELLEMVKQLTTMLLEK